MRPNALQKGDKIAIIATAKAIEKADVEKTRIVFESWGLEVVYGSHLFDRHHQFAGTDAQRHQDLQWALDNPEIRAVICARGGYGTTRILDNIDFSSFAKNPKWVCGFSDITVLLSKITQLGVESLHGPMPIFFNLGLTEPSIQYLRNAFFGKELKYELKSNSLNVTGNASGILTGGNLSMICNSIGTSSELNMEGKILFIEDLTEYLYHLDRMMVQLVRSGSMAKLKGLVVGHFSKMQDNPIPFGQSVEEIILEHSKDYGFPVIFDFPTGHEPENHTLVCGRNTKLYSDKERSHLIQ